MNTKEVKHDEELILKWDLPLATPKSKPEKKPSTWVDHVAMEERKRRKKGDVGQAVVTAL